MLTYTLSPYPAVMSLEAPNEEAYLQRLLTVQKHDRRAAMALADAPAVPQLQWEEGNVPQEESLQVAAEPLACGVPSIAAVSASEPVAAVESFAQPRVHEDTASNADARCDDGATKAAKLAASNAGDGKEGVGSAPVRTERTYRRSSQRSNRRDSSRSDASGSASHGGSSSSGRSETAARIRFHAAAAAKGRAADALEPPTPDQVPKLSKAAFEYVRYANGAVLSSRCT